MKNVDRYLHIHKFLDEYADAEKWIGQEVPQHEYYAKYKQWGGRLALNSFTRALKYAGVKVRPSNGVTFYFYSPGN